MSKLQKQFYTIVDDSTYEILGETFHRYQVPLLSLAEKLHMSVRGSSDPLFVQEGLVAYGYIKARLETWQEPSIYSAMYDSAVFLLLSAVAREYEIEHLEHDLDEFFKRDEPQVDRDWIYMVGKFPECNTPPMDDDHEQ